MAVPALPLALIAVIAAWALAGGESSASTMLAVFATVAALAAARERRTRDAALAAGIAAGLSSAGLALLPVLLGTAVSRRAVLPLLRLSIPACAATSLALGWTLPDDAALTAIAPADFLILLPATACGIAAWLGASCARRSPSATELDSAALLACLVLPLLLPVGIEPVGIAVALALGGAPLTLRPLAFAANDDPLPLRARPA